jgi:NADP-dependent 3-hydroxy acid dehydrogenase YdfG
VPAEGSAARVAVLTGAGGAIGGALAAGLGTAGYGLHLVVRRGSPVAGLVDRFGAAVVEADLSDRSALEAACKALRELPRVDVLVHAAGTWERGETATLPAETLDALYEVNLRAPYVLTRALLPQLRASAGELVFVNSSAGVAPGGAATGAYAATKHALRALADAVRAEENANGVRVLSVYPGRTASRLQERIHEAEGRPYEPERLAQPDDVATAVLGALALPRTAELTDLHVRPMQGPAR